MTNNNLAVILSVLFVAAVTICSSGCGTATVFTRGGEVFEGKFRGRKHNYVLLEEDSSTDIVFLPNSSIKSVDHPSEILSAITCGIVGLGALWIGVAAVTREDVEDPGLPNFYDAAPLSAVFLIPPCVYGLSDLLKSVYNYHKDAK